MVIDNTMEKVHNINALRVNRKKLRNSLTPAEAKLWTFLRDSQLENKKFRRQHSVGPYVLDFYCPAEKLCIELDGEGHFNETSFEYDSARTEYLNGLNIRVLRFENRKVFENTEAVLEEIRKNFKQTSPDSSPPILGGVAAGRGGSWKFRQTTPDPSLTKEGSFEADDSNKKGSMSNYNGFKETEIGLLPEDWGVTCFKNAIRKDRIRTPESILQSEYKSIGKYPVVDQGKDYIAGYTDDETSLLKEPLPVILFGDHTRIFKFIDFPFGIGADGTKLIFPSVEIFHPKFLFYFFRSIDIPSKGYNRHFKFLKERDIVHPPLPEQQKIASVLSAVQEAKEKAENVLSALKELKKSMMKRLFTYGAVSLEEAERVPLKETEIGMMPERWDTKKLGVLFDIKQGKALSQKFKKGISPYPFLRTANVLWGKLDLSNVDTMDFTEDETLRMNLQSGDLLVCEGGDIGRTAIWDGQIKNCSYQNHLHRLRPSESDTAYPLFYMYWMQTALLLFGLYVGTGNKTTIPNLSRGRLAEYLLPLPPLPEQHQIAEAISAIDEKIQAEQTKKNTIDTLFKTLLSLLMTGKVRVKDLEMPV